MARRPLALGGLAAAIAAAILLALIALPLGAVLRAAARQGGWHLGPADLAALRFTLVQAALSAALSVALAIPVARALARRRFRGRGAMVTLMGAPFLLPTIVAVLGLLAVFGRGGALNAGLAALGLPAVSIYGLQGVVLAHVFFNLPLAVRLILQGWAAVPAERFRLAASLGAGPAGIARLIERPMLREVAPGALAIVFLVCLTSFAVALVLGGGPRATTLELAIYQAVRFEFDLGRAATLAALQAAIGLAAASLGLLVALPSALGGGWGAPVERWDAGGPGARALDAGWLALAAAFLGAPMAAVILAGLPALGGLPAPVWEAAWRSLIVALASAALCTGLALALAAGRPRARWPEGIAALGLAVSPLAIGTGAFLLVFPHVDPARLALPVTAALNAALALPFALRALAPAAREAEALRGRLADHLGVRGLARLRIVMLPALARPLGFGAGLAAALSAGDLGVIALLVDPQRPTLPLQMFRLMGAYRMEDAAGAALLLLALALALFAAFDLAGRRAAAR